jgi:putative membrane protein
MKQRLFIIPAVLLVLALMACPKTETTSDTSSTTSTSMTDTSSTTSTDTSGTTTMAANNTAAAGGVNSNMDEGDKAFIMKAAQGGLAEVELGNMAVQKATNADVKAFGQHMVDDHSKANDELKQLATTKGLTVPTDIGEEHKKTADDLSKKSGKDFDKGYMKAMVEDHEKDVAEFEKMSKDAKDADLKAWVTKTLPTLQGHLQMAKETAKKVK